MRDPNRLQGEKDVGETRSDIGPVRHMAVGKKELQGILTRVRKYLKASVLREGKEVL